MEIGPGRRRPVPPQPGLEAKRRRNGDRLEVSGTVPITFAVWGIPNPGFGPVTAEAHGLLELLLVFERAT